MGLVFLFVLAVVTVDGWRAFGKGASGARLERMQRSPQWRDGAFENPQPIINGISDTVTGMLDVSEDASPASPPPTVQIDPKMFATPPPSGLRVTWLGHSTILVELEGKRVMTDPMFSERSSPLTWIGPRRWAPPAIALADLPELDAIVISHDHYDHLDHGTIVALKDRNTKFIVPLGIGAHLEYWGVAVEKIVELDWWEKFPLGDGVEVVCTPARHASGRTLWDKDATLWAGYALIGPQRRVYYSGDTGLFPAMKDIGEKLGPFDMTMIETGQYHRGWPDWHLGPEQALVAHQMVRGRIFLPAHWGLLQLAYHGWTEPIERVLDAAQEQKLAVVAPKLGESVELGEPGEQIDRWWPKLPYETAAQHPIISSQMN